MSNQPQPVAQILIQLFPGGQMAVAGPPDEILSLGMIEKAKEQLLKHFAAQAAKPKLAIAPPGMRFPEPPLNGKH